MAKDSRVKNTDECGMDFYAHSHSHSYESKNIKRNLLIGLVSCMSDMLHGDMVLINITITTATTTTNSKYNGEALLHSDLMWSC